MWRAVAAHLELARLPALTRRVGGGFEQAFDLGSGLSTDDGAPSSTVHSPTDVPGHLSAARPRFRAAPVPQGISPGSRTTQIPTRQGWPRMAAADRDKSLDAALAQIERQFGKGSVMRLGRRDARARSR